VSDLVYVPLVGEGTDCWRPVHADRIDGDIYEITVDKEPDGERWPFRHVLASAAGSMCFPMEELG